ncbi:helix-turn-helix domain-containing protein [Microbispora sp. CA-102843]|uniref:helix-turn-helix domain-containing protein n=1 Tax=Microbispora sp. CA-102843 TaxID=3239952 RepID=UPI003D8F31A7
MRYAQGGGFTPQEQQRREEIRLQAAEMFAQGVTNSAVAQTLRVTQRSVERWRRAWREGGTAALASAGPHALPRPGSARRSSPGWRPNWNAVRWHTGSPTSTGR